MKFELKFKNEVYNALYITSEKEASAIVSELYELDGPIGIDTETQPLPVYKNYDGAALSPHLGSIRLIQLFHPTCGVYVFDLNYVPSKIFIQFLEHNQFIGHYSIFDLGFFKKMGVKDMNIGCTFIATKLLYHALYPDDGGKSASLEAVMKAIFKEDISKKMQKSEWGKEELTFEQIEYAAYDPLYAYKVATKLAPSIEKYGLGKIYDLYKKAQHPIAELELNGIYLNKEDHKTLVEVWRDELYAARNRVLKETGLKEITSHALGKWLEESLPDAILNAWPETPTGKLSTNAHTFADFAHLPIVEPLAAYQKLEKLSSTYGISLLDHINPKTERIHAKFNICGARTGRLSSSNINLQNIPRDVSIRQNFQASGRNILLCADLSQIELRVAAELSRDKQMLKAYREGIDLHALTASKISGKRIEDVTTEDRRLAKAINFGLLFGLGKGKFCHYARLSYGVEISQEDAERAISIFFETYAGYRKWQLEQAEKAKTTFRCTTPMGKLRRLPENNTYGNSMNQPIQGGAAEIMLISLIFMSKDFKETTAKLVSCVHDEVIVECHPKDADITKETIAFCMESGFLTLFPKGITRGLVEVNIGKSWNEAK